MLRFTNADVVRQPDAALMIVERAIHSARSTEDRQREWRRADSLRIGDTLYFGPGLQPVPVTRLEHEETSEDVYDLEVEGSHSFITEVCAVHNCGSGTTAYMAEGWGEECATLSHPTPALPARWEGAICLAAPAGRERSVSSRPLGGSNLSPPARGGTKGGDLLPASLPLHHDPHPPRPQLHLSTRLHPGPAEQLDSAHR